MKKLKRILCLFLALVMCLGMVNISALAAEDECPYSRKYGGDGSHSWYNGICVYCQASQDGKDSGNPEETSPCQHINYTVIGESATCEEDGWEAIKCQDCGHEWNRHVCPKTGHSYVDGKCKYCGEDDPNAKIEEPENPEHEHKMVGKPYGCDDSKCYIYSCEIEGCDYSYTTDHEWVGNFSDGNGDNDTHHRECRVCNAKEAGVAHTWSEWKEVKPATEKEEGLESRSCLECEARQDKSIPVKGHQHTPVFHKGYAPTCTEPGCKDYYCCSDPNCGKTFLDAEGKTEATKEEKEIPALGHDLMHCSGKEATCTEAGAMESWVCNRVVDGKLCGAHFTDAECKNPVNDKADLVIPTLEPVFDGATWIEQDSLKHYRHCVNCDGKAEGHTEFGLHNNWEFFTKEATCTEDGYTEKKCPDCGYTETTKIPAKGHQTEIIVDNEPTCTMKGNEHEACTVCGVTVESKENPALGHNWGGWQSDSAKGHYQVCDRCQSHSDTVDHNFGAWETVKAATTTEEGEEKHVCADCNYEETRTTSKIVVENPGNPGDKDPIDTKPPVTDVPDDNPPTTGDTNGNPEDKDPIESNPPETDIPDDNPPTTGDTDGTTDIPDGETPTTDIPGELTDIFDENVPLAYVDGKLNTTDHFAYIIGYPEGDVRPNANITRAEAVTVFFRLMTEEFRSANWSSENAYPDVESGNWFNNAISTASKAGIFKGDEAGNARPNDAITRAEFAALAARFISGQITDDGTGDFADTADHWAAAEIRLAVKAGWIRGVGGNKFEPDRNITRAEVMAIVNRMLDRTPDKDHMLSDMKVWSDNMDTSAWYYADVQEATNSHDYERAESATEIWTAMEEIRDWNALEKVWATAESGK